MRVSLAQKAIVSARAAKNNKNPDDWQMISRNGKHDAQRHLEKASKDMVAAKKTATEDSLE